jgi:hypothetical protein
VDETRRWYDEIDRERGKADAMLEQISYRMLHVGYFGPNAGRFEEGRDYIGALKRTQTALAAVLDSLPLPVGEEGE